MDLKDFEARKADHLRLALDPKNKTECTGLDSIELIHEALPELDFSEIDLATKFWGYKAASPCFISSMTAGHKDGESLNLVLARVAAEKKWPMGVGSQRRELSDTNAGAEWKRLRRAVPKACFFSNIGITQVITNPAKTVLKILENLEAEALIVHTNPLQEAIQPEGTPSFRGGLKALEKLCKSSSVPVILKETGCGFSSATLKQLRNTGLAAVDISGLGGTHWGRIEGARAGEASLQRLASETFQNWGISTLKSLQAATASKGKWEIWASGGLRNGLDAAKTIALGAHKAGFAGPALAHAVKGEEYLAFWMARLEFEFKLALFCTGSKTPTEIRKGKRWLKI